MENFPFAEIEAWIRIAKGDIDGHAFHGNQYTSGEGGTAQVQSEVASRDTTARNTFGYFGSPSSSSTATSHPYKSMPERYDAWGSTENRAQYNTKGLSPATKVVDDLKKTLSQSQNNVSNIVDRDKEQRNFAIDKLKGMVKDGTITPAFGNRAIIAQQAFLDGLNKSTSSFGKPISLNGLAPLANKADKATETALSRSNGDIDFSVLNTPNQLAAHIESVKSALYPSVNGDKGWGHIENAQRISDLRTTIQDFLKNDKATSLLGRGSAQARSKVEALKSANANLDGIVNKLSSLASTFKGAASSGWGDEDEDEDGDSGYSQEEESAYQRTASVEGELSNTLDTITSALADSRKP